MAGNKNKDMAVLMEQAEDQGWTIVPTQKGHFKWVAPTGAIVFTSSTPSDGNAVHQIRRDLVKRGFLAIEKKPKKKRR